MKQRRPTIPLSKWSLAVDLEQTRAIQNQKGMPAYGCNCDLCAEWKRVFQKLVPSELNNQFQRIGIDLKSPTEVYGTGTGNEERNIRILFHMVGKILSGPDAFSFNDQLQEQIQHYEVIRVSPYFSVRVLPENKSWQASPSLPSGTKDNVICIDIRLSYPAEYLPKLKLANA